MWTSVDESARAETSVTLAKRMVVHNPQHLLLSSRREIIGR
jgi:hypothetical protein